MEAPPVRSVKTSDGFDIAYTVSGPQLEFEVLQLIAVGRTNQQIADCLVIGPHIVLRHVSTILEKAGVDNRAEAATYANRLGLL
jgi:DNA-binding CsgD family transcriptional regulator